MDFSSFFDYPDKSEDQNASPPLVFLGKADKASWEKLIDHCIRVPFHAGEIVIRQGDPSQSLYIVAEGELEVVVSTAEQKELQQVARIAEKSIFGEQSFFDGKPRSANVRALTDGELLELTAAKFEILAAHDPHLSRAMLFDLGRILSLRLRETTTLMLRNLR